jgi:hypothetical protein
VSQSRLSKGVTAKVVIPEDLRLLQMEKATAEVAFCCSFSISIVANGWELIGNFPVEKFSAGNVREWSHVPTPGTWGTPSMTVAPT